MTYKKLIYGATITVLLVSLAVCKGSAEQSGFISIFSGEGKQLVLKDFKQLKNNDIMLTFSGNVTTLKVHSLREGSAEKTACICELMEADNSVSVFKVHPLGEFKIGEGFNIVGSVEHDKNGVLDFSLPFRGVNTNPAKLKFSEIRIGTPANPAYIKFTVISGGNLCGLYLYSSGEKEKNYVFPDAEVSSGETVMLHRWLPENADSAVDEINSDIECSLPEADRSARDFWCRIKKFTAQKTNIFLLKSEENGEIQDAFLCVNHKDLEWKKSGIEAAAQDVEKAKMWKPDASPESAVQIEKNNQIFVRNLNKELQKSAGEWSLKKAPVKPKTAQTKTPSKKKKQSSGSKKP